MVAKKSAVKPIGLVTLLVTLLVSCATPSPQMTTQFKEEEFLPFAGSGTSTIQGAVKDGTGNTVYLIPVTSYTREVWQASLQGKKPDKDPRMEKYTRTTVTDRSGNFTFQNIPAGEYYLECSISREVATGAYGTSTVSSVARAQVKVEAGKTITVTLTE